MSELAEVLIEFSNKLDLRHYMTFEQSELQRLVEEIIELLERCSGDPPAIKNLLLELRTLYNKIPIYPGIIARCLPLAVQPIGIEHLKDGQEVTIHLKDNRILAGRVVSVAPTEVKLAECQEFEPPKLSSEITVPMRDVHEVKLLTRKVLQREWPDLDFRE